MAFSTCAKCLAIAFIALGILGGVYKQNVYRFMKVNSLFHKDSIVHNFRNLDDLGFDVVNVSTGGAPVAELIKDRVESQQLPSSFEWNGTSFVLEDWLEKHWTTG